MYFDGALNLDGAGAGVLLISPSGDELRYVLQIHFSSSNNATKYEAALHGVRIAVSLGVKRLMVYGNSALVINQVKKDWSYTSEKMDAYCAEIRKLEEVPTDKIEMERLTRYSMHYILVGGRLMKKNAKEELL
ncbi:uncharacterized protein [Miscanthus floridulus]|uniref:uncharacterized protein n=1 Tax=Miscanthus floridulus TaxID=154761 RepID=UPI0034590511